MSAIEVYEAIKDRLGTEGARKLLDHIDRQLGDRVATKEDLRYLREQMATKGDLTRLREQMATKDDLNYLREQMATKEDLNYLREQMATKDDLNYLREQMATKEDLIKLEWRFKLYIILLAVLIIITNPRVIELFGRIIGIVR